MSELQRGWDWRHLWRPSSPTPAWAGAARAGWALYISKDGDSTTSLGDPIPVFGHLPLCLNRISCILFCVCCLLAIYWAPLRRTFLWTIPARSAFCSNPLIIFMALCLTCSRMFLSFLYWGAQHSTQHSSCVSQVLSRGEGSPPSTCWQCSA